MVGWNYQPASLKGWCGGTPINPYLEPKPVDPVDPWFFRCSICGKRGHLQNVCTSKGPVKTTKTEKWWKKDDTDTWWIDGLIDAMFFFGFFNIYIYIIYLYTWIILDRLADAMIDDIIILNILRVDSLRNPKYELLYEGSLVVPCVSLFIGPLFVFLLFYA